MSHNSRRHLPSHRHASALQGRVTRFYTNSTRFSHKILNMDTLFAIQGYRRDPAEKSQTLPTSLPTEPSGGDAVQYRRHLAKGHSRYKSLPSSVQFSSVQFIQYTYKNYTKLCTWCTAFMLRRTN